MKGAHTKRMYTLIIRCVIASKMFVPIVVRVCVCVMGPLLSLLVAHFKGALFLDIIFQIIDMTNEWRIREHGQRCRSIKRIFPYIYLNVFWLFAFRISQPHKTMTLQQKKENTLSVFLESIFHRFVICNYFTRKKPSKIKDDKIKRIEWVLYVVHPLTSTTIIQIENVFPDVHSLSSIGLTECHWIK